ncbi:preprotein translocase subunit SecE [Mucispirillum schaedleri]|uniref:Protein translocase subunit SecE n=1 Tax=Mucispirillum schaedleri ASF457 TaxID=1379858 RepID=V2QDP4_9BACT|nr:preprotein translocase subunit SecE [Mucispirillum schaedleri]MCX4359923.1 preprotein translocase subunit SecE [Mucispirillum schaedleri]USF23853.1 Protein translocase subunit SecE [Mucispirillum schaedleri ASF457]SIW06807.1 Protein translocase subunit SecE [Mucispirillum schaedleri ASF457]
MKSFNPVSFYNQVRDELKKVNWPARETTISTSIVVVVVVGLITAYLGVVDAIVSRLAGQIIG